MSNISGINKNFSVPQVKTNEGGKRVASKETGESPKMQMNKLIIELTLNIKTESKDGFGTQAGIKALSDSIGIDLSQFQYNGKPITDLSQDEAKALISEDGYFGVKKTAQRIFDFAVGMAGDDPKKMQAARDAVLKGFKEAENIFGGKLPDISHKTIDKVLEMIDAKISALGGSVVDGKA